ncbi:MAG: ribonuclease H-like YkuK family protein [Patescibacteria group bacterium]
MTTTQDHILFSTPSRGRMILSEVVEDIARFVRSQPEQFYKIIIGSDSQAASPTAIVTAVTVWRVGNGAVHFWTTSEERPYAMMRDRIWAEAIRSITLAQEVRGRLEQTLGDDFFWDGNEVHVDIGENGPTREMIDSVVGMIKGYNFVPVIKPYSFGASIVADRHT